MSALESNVWSATRRVHNHWCAYKENHRSIAHVVCHGISISTAQWWVQLRRAQIAKFSYGTSCFRLWPYEYLLCLRGGKGFQVSFLFWVFYCPHQGWLHALNNCWLHRTTPVAGREAKAPFLFGVGGGCFLMFFVVCVCVWSRSLLRFWFRGLLPPRVFLPVCLHGLVFVSWMAVYGLGMLRILVSVAILVRVLLIRLEGIRSSTVK